MRVDVIRSFDPITWLKYLFVGGATACLYFLLFSLLYSGLGMGYELATSISYLVSVLAHFIANYRYTFSKQASTHVLKVFVKYLCMVLINYLITLAVVYTVVEVLDASPYVGVACAIGVTVLIGYCLSKCWVFSGERSPSCVV